MADKPAPAASPHLLRLLIRQNEESLRGFRGMPPQDWESKAGRQHLMIVQDLRTQTVALNERLQWLADNPPAPRPRRTWRDLVPAVPSASPDEI